MNRKLLGLSVAAAMLLAATSAFAGGVNLSWNNCFGEGTGAANKTFACAANTGTNIMVVSFIPDADNTLVSGNEIVMDFLSASNPLPAWWEFKDPGTCRTTSLGTNFTANANDVVCIDWAAGQSAGGVGAYNAELGTINPTLSTQHRRLKIAVAVPLSALADIFAGTEYFSCNVTVNNAKTVGTGACAGCTTQMCIVLNSLKITTNTPGGAGDVTLGNGASAGSNIITWQGPGPDCQLVPTRNVTWGSVKALYR